jgi:hypothetical protein
MNHLFEIDKKFDDALVPELLTWMKETLAASPHATRFFEPLSRVRGALR